MSPFCGLFQRRIGVLVCAAAAAFAIGGPLLARAQWADSHPNPPGATAPGGPSPGEAALLSPFDAEVQLGDRLFFETRFSQFFFAHCNGDVNTRLAQGDPVLTAVTSHVGKLDGPFRGESINCRQCHFGDDFLEDNPLAGRTYCDFSQRSAVPRRDDGLVHTPRNAPLMIDLGLAREAPMLLHFDGEFVTEEDLVIDTMTGRNFGWLPAEAAAAAAHAARVIREDDGQNPRHVTYTPGGRGIPYRVVMLGADPAIPRDLRLPERYRLDVMTASDGDVLNLVARLMHAYMDSLRFGTTRTLRESKSPYDTFLAKNDLPTAPNAGESNGAYADRLLDLIRKKRASLVWVGEDDGEVELHTQPYRFGPTELQGLETFFTRGGSGRRAAAGNCIACHTPPRFTDHTLHNNGVSQGEYDAVFGAGAFAALEIPDLAARNAQHDRWLPATSKHPNATGRFKSAAAAGRKGWTDLGAWNVFANPDMPKPQTALTQIFCGRRDGAPQPCTPDAVLPLTIATFKTPSIRDLGQSNPYFHTGAMRTVGDVLRFYVRTSNLARAGKVRNAAPELSGVHLAAADLAPLEAFLRSLNEDYQ